METLRRVIGVVGATGLVGREALSILEARQSKKNFIGSVKLWGSERGNHEPLRFCGSSVAVEPLTENTSFNECDAVFFCAGTDVSLKYARKAVSQGTYVIDKSTAFRLTDGVPLVVPDVNGAVLTELRTATLIANPNCATIPLTYGLQALHKAFGVEDVVVTTFQSVSGAGKDAMEIFAEQTRQHVTSWKPSVFEKRDQSKGVNLEEQNLDPRRVFSTVSALNVIPMIGPIDSESGYCDEEIKTRLETQKILSMPGLSLSATTVRVPVMVAHSESVSVTLSRAPQLKDVEMSLSQLAHHRFYDRLSKVPPTPREVSGTDIIAVGRVRIDPSNPRRVHYWIVSDNLRRGAATNAIDILERLFADRARS